jgi:hypothetical protein
MRMASKLQDRSQSPKPRQPQAQALPPPATTAAVAHCGSRSKLASTGAASRSAGTGQPRHPALGHAHRDLQEIGDPLLRRREG